mmetsp:Transcript_25867/g.65207  ORF Transcript_25867/g.65207 Transcript_25867/m.65207 type:complete len:203 (+) Transcript_25867:1003-1611(+)
MVHSCSGRLGESTILTTRSSPLPLRNMSRTVEACANTCPPIGFGKALNVAPTPPEGSAITWFVSTTAMLNSWAIFASRFSVFPSSCCRSASSPRPEKSCRKMPMMESMMRMPNCPELSSTIIVQASFSSAFKCSEVIARAVTMFPMTSSGSTLCAAQISWMRSARKVPSVSMYMHLPGKVSCSCAWTASVWHSCVLPQRNSP